MLTECGPIKRTRGTKVSTEGDDFWQYEILVKLPRSLLMDCLASNDDSMETTIGHMKEI